MPMNGIDNSLLKRYTIAPLAVAAEASTLSAAICQYISDTKRASNLENACDGNGLRVLTELYRQSSDQAELGEATELVTCLATLNANGLADHSYDSFITWRGEYEHIHESLPVVPRHADAVVATHYQQAVKNLGPDHRSQLNLSIGLSKQAHGARHLDLDILEETI